MYKITLFDQNCPSCCSGVAEFYCDNIDEFEKKWLTLEKDENTIDLFRRSKNGECVTDYYSDDPELDIVQYDGEAEIYHTMMHLKSNRELVLHNSYGSPATYFIDLMLEDHRYVKFKDEYMLLAAYKVEGICTEAMFREGMYSAATCWGNPVLEHDTVFGGYSENHDDYAENTIASFVFYRVRTFASREELEVYYTEHKNESLTDEELDMIMKDIPGEAG